MGRVTDFIFLGFKITADGDSSMKSRHLLFRRKLLIDLDRVLKSRNITLLVFPVVMYRCESWTIKKAEC